MKLTFGRYFLQLTKPQLVALIIVPLLLIMLVSHLQNRKPMYEVSMVVNPNVAEPARPARGALKSYSREFRRLYAMKFRQEKAQAQLRLLTKQATLQSNRLKYAFIQHYYLKPILFPKRWDLQTQQWMIPEPGIIAKTLGMLRAMEPKERQPKEPSDFKSAKKLKIMVKKDKETGFFHLTFKHSDPYQATQILNNYIAFADEFIAQDRVKELLKKADFLKSIYASERKQSVKAEIAAEMSYTQVLLHTQTGQTDKSFTVIDPAAIPERPIFKFSPIISIIVFLFGFMVTLMIVLNRPVKSGTDSISKKVH